MPRPRTRTGWGGARDYTDGPCVCLDCCRQRPERWAMREARNVSAKRSMKKGTQRRWAGEPKEAKA